MNWFPLRSSQFFRNMFPENIIQATFEQAQTTYKFQKSSLIPVNSTQDMINVTMKRTVEYKPGTNVLGKLEPL